MNVDNPLISICIPTYNRCSILEKTLFSICDQDIFKNTDFVEIVISDNNSSDDTRSVCSKYVDKYGKKVKYYKNCKNIYDKNIEKALSKGTGVLLKLNNDTLSHQPESLSIMLSIVHKYSDVRPLIFFLNRSLPGDNERCFKNMDGFMSAISYYSTWIGGFAIWKEDYLTINDFCEYSDRQLMQTDVLFKNSLQKSIYVVCNHRLFNVLSVDLSKGGYDFLKVFVDNYFNLLCKYESLGVITTNTCVNEKKKMMICHVCSWAARSKEAYYATFDVDKHWCYLKRYFGRDYRVVILYSVKYFKDRIIYRLKKRRLFAEFTDKCAK
jgi:glycosyltransferase involved in cell wall biosynthesis